VPPPPLLVGRRWWRRAGGHLPRLAGDQVLALGCRQEARGGRPRVERRRQDGGEEQRRRRFEHKQPAPARPPPRARDGREDGARERPANDPTHRRRRHDGGVAKAHVRLAEPARQVVNDGREKACLGGANRQARQVKAPHGGDGAHAARRERPAGEEGGEAPVRANALDRQRGGHAEGRVRAEKDGRARPILFRRQPEGVVHLERRKRQVGAVEVAEEGGDKEGGEQPPPHLGHDDRVEGGGRLVPVPAAAAARNAARAVVLGVIIVTVAVAVGRRSGGSVGGDRRRGGRRGGRPRVPAIRHPPTVGSAGDARRAPSPVAATNRRVAAAGSRRARLDGQQPAHRDRRRTSPAAVTVGRRHAGDPDADGRRTVGAALRRQ